jgi:hypothetical protein
MKKMKMEHSKLAATETTVFNDCYFSVNEKLYFRASGNWRYPKFILLLYPSCWLSCRQSFTDYFARWLDTGAITLTLTIL